MDDFNAKLATMQANYAAAKAQQEQLFGGSKIDPGVYEARLTKAELKLSKKGSLQIKRTHIIISAGAFEGIPVTDYMNLETEYGFAFARRWIELTGNTCPDNAKELPKTIASISEGKTAFRIEVRRDGDFTNVSVIEMLTEGGEGGEADTGVEDTTTAADAPVEDESLAALKAFAVSQDIEIAEEDDADAVKEKISAYNYESGKLSEDEIRLLEDNGLVSLIQRPEPPKPAAKVPAKKPVAPPAKKSAPPKRK
jgi:hypothetical protein